MNPSEGTTLVFENGSQLEVYRRFRPFSFDALGMQEFLQLFPESMNLNAPSREDLKEKLTLADARDTELFLNTLETLREAFIFTHADVDYAFSLLPTNPKNEGLKNLIHQIIDSPFSEDRFRAMEGFIENLSESTFPLPLTKVVFVRSFEPSHAFDEMARAFQKHQETKETALIEFWELGNPEKTKPPLVLAGPHFACLEKLAKTARKRSGLITTALHPSTLSFLKMSLAHEGVENAEIVPIQPLPNLPGNRLIILDETFFEIENRETFLSSDEWDTLFWNGFRVPHTPSRLARRKVVLENISRTPRRSVLFATDGKFTLPMFAKARRLSQALNVNVPAREEAFPLPPSPLSATGLENYARCPSKYLFQNRFKFRPEKTLMEEFPLLFGQATHSALENGFKESRHPDENRLMDLFQDSLSSLAPKVKETHPLRLLLKESFRRVAKTLPTLERELAAIVGETTPQFFEKDFNLEIEGNLFRGKIDRIDRTTNGVFVVLDYKTGRVDFSPQHISGGYHFQALLYFLAVEDLKVPCAGVLFYDLKEGELRRGILSETYIETEAKKHLTRGHVLTPEKWEVLFQEGRTHLREFGERIRRGDFLPTPSAEACRGCEYPGMCRSKEGYLC